MSPAARAHTVVRFALGDPTKTTTSVLVSAEEVSVRGSSMQQEPPLTPPEDELLGGEAAGGEVSHKSERKRQRERQRRSALASAFEELTALLAQLEPDSAASLTATGNDNMDSSMASKRKRRKPSGAEDLEDSAGMTRLDLIGRTVGVLRRLQQENADLKRRLTESAAGGGDSDQKVRFQIKWLVGCMRFCMTNVSALKYFIHFSGSFGNGSYFVTNRSKLLARASS